VITGGKSCHSLSEERKSERLTRNETWEFFGGGRRERSGGRVEARGTASCKRDRIILKTSDAKKRW